MTVITLRSGVTVLLWSNLISTQVQHYVLKVDIPYHEIAARRSGVTRVGVTRGGN